LEGSLTSHQVARLFVRQRSSSEDRTMRNELPRPDWASLLETVSVDIVCVAKAPDDEAGYRVTCTDAETGKVFGRRLFPAVACGGPPLITFGDIVEMMGGSYRCLSVLVEIQGQKALRRNRRISDMLRRHRRGWLRRSGYDRRLAEVSL
jgi:hypothetical protein